MSRPRPKWAGYKRWGGGSYLKRWRCWWFEMARRGGLWWLQAAPLLLLQPPLLSPVFLSSFFFSSPPVFRSLLGFLLLCFFSFGLSALLCSLSSLLLLPSLFFSLTYVPPVFIGKNRGGTWLGRPLCCLPSTGPPTRGKCGLCASFWRGSWWKQGKEKIFFFPCLARPGEEENP